MEPTPSRPIRWRALALAAGVPAAFGALMFVYRFGDVLARGGDRGRAGAILLEEMTGAYAAVPSVIALVGLVAWRPITGATWPRRVPLYGAMIVLLGVVSTLLMWGSRTLLFPAFGFGRYDYGDLWWRIPMELGHQVILFSLLIGVFHYARQYRVARAAELRAAELEVVVARAQLDAIEARLEPHFIFNTLNTISAVMYEDVGEADRLLARLGDLLRRAMARDAPATVPLREEMAWLEAYVALMERRFGPRLTVEVASDPTAAAIEVPRYLLQPLVENAIRHGVAAKAGPGRVEVLVRREGDRVRLEVRDDGVGLETTGGGGAGIGLDHTASRLSLMYGTRHRFEIARRPTGGTVATIELPATGGRTDR